MKKLFLVSALVLGSSFSAPQSAKAYNASCSFSDGDSWWGSAPTTLQVAEMGLRCKSQGGTITYSHSSFWEMLGF